MTSPFETPEQTRFNALSLGAGVQSSTMALMASHGLIDPMPEIAIFADTGEEPVAVYQWLDYLEPLLAFPVVRVQSKVTLREQTFKVRRRAQDNQAYIGWTIPVFTRNDNGSVDMRMRKCTREHKIRPIESELRRRVSPPRGYKKPLATNWIGISYDEMRRAKRSDHPWLIHRFPLLERKVYRLDCLRWMKDNGYETPPRSACVMCPYHSDKEWLKLKGSFTDFDNAVQFERDMQEIAAKNDITGKIPYLHRSCVPLDQVDFHDSHVQRDMWGEECSGMCNL